MKWGLTTPVFLCNIIIGGYQCAKHCPSDKPKGQTNARSSEWIPLSNDCFFVHIVTITGDFYGRFY